MNVPLLVVSITAIGNLALLLVLYRRRSADTNIKSLTYFTAAVMFLVLWTVANYFVDSSHEEAAALFWTRATFPPSLLMCFFILLFSNSFPVVKPVRSWVYPLYGLAVAASTVVIFTKYGVPSVVLTADGRVGEVAVGGAYPLVVLVILSLIVHPTYIFFRTYRESAGRIREQARYVVLGWGSFLLFAFFTNALLPLLTGNATWGALGPLGSIVMVGSVTYAIIRHSLFDIKIIVQRGLIYSVLLSLSALVYLILLFVIEQLFSRGIEVDAVVGAFFTAMIAIVGAAPLERYFKRITDPIFYKDTYDYAAVLSELADVLNRNLSEKVIVKKSTEVLLRTLHPTELVFRVDTKFVPATFAPALTIPIKTKKKQIGLLLFGEKRSGDAYTKDDVSLVTTFASQAGVALEKARLYAEVKDYAHTLEKKVAERTAEIVELHQEQETMMHEISHGLQTPLTIMKGELYFLRKQGYETDKIDIIDSSINRISVFINKLLGLYRLETAKPAKRTTIELGTLLAQIGDGLASMLARQGIGFELQAPKSVRVKGDLDGLEEVFSNLLHNAIKYAKPNGGTHITVSLKAEKDWAEVRVTDTGIGVPKDEVAKLFTKFYRVRGESTRHVSGTGLGLVITKKIVERHGGEIAVESEFGIGTTFIVRLPKK